MRLRFLASLIVFAAALSCGAAVEPSFNDGEEFRFRVAWGPFRSAGMLSVKAQHEANDGKLRVRIQTETKTNGVIRAFYPFDGYSDCVFDGQDGKLLTAFATTKTSSKETNALAVMDYPANLMRYEDRIDKTRTQELPLPEGRPMDMITTLLTARKWDLKPGERADVTVMFDKDFYELTIYADRVEKISTDQGEMDAIVLTPKMEKNPRGLFKRGGQVHVWVTQDAMRLPVRLQVQMKFGTGTALLTDYKPGNPPSGKSLAASP